MHDEIVTDLMNIELIAFEFYVEFEGNQFNVHKIGDDFVVHDDQKDAFTALVFG